MSRRIFRCWRGHYMCSYFNGGSCWRIECNCALGRCEACR